MTRFVFDPGEGDRPATRDEPGDPGYPPSVCDESGDVIAYLNFEPTDDDEMVLERTEKLRLLVELANRGTT